MVDFRYTLLPCTVQVAFYRQLIKFPVHPQIYPQFVVVNGEYRRKKLDLSAERISRDVTFLT